MINLCNHPLVIRARFRAIFPDDSDVSFQFESDFIVVFIKDYSLMDLVPKKFEQIPVKIVFIK